MKTVVIVSISIASTEGISWIRTVHDKPSGILERALHSMMGFWGGS